MDNNRKMSNVKINGETIKSFAFADDNYTVFSNEQGNSITDQVRELMKVMKKFKKISGLDINVSKSEILTNDENFRINEVRMEGIEIKSAIKALGVEIGKNVDLTSIMENKINRSIESLEEKKTQ